MSADTTRSEADGPDVTTRRRVRPEPSYVALERRLLCERIAELERELQRERERREDVVEQYERLLREREAADDGDGLLSGLFGT
ncbi:hypothetical protein [Halomicrobium salinisoli]|uniref:hypothetical protein n=1 Tax=Halomicrobium salinisoli TaxID=2878391 RepID=UPI001CF0B643|nr:hypothetical protein [Halomicrobium salinisoli]